jgi:hypothetical protein
MTGSIPPVGPLSYEGSVAVPFIVRKTTPLSTNNNFPVPTIWINSSTEMAYIQVAKPLGVAVWITLGGAPSALETITTPDSVVVVPSAGNINFVNGSSMTITGSGANITFNATGGGLAWNNVSGTSQTISVNNGYTNANGSLTTFTLPSTAAYGSVMSIVGVGSGGWTLVENSGQTIYFGNKAATTTSGSLSSAHRRDCITLLCVVADTDFEVIDSIGNITVV